MDEEETCCMCLIVICERWEEGRGRGRGREGRGEL